MKNIETLYGWTVKELPYKSAVICARQSVTDGQSESRIATILLAIPKTSHAL
jgi:hypothetical protein